MDMTAFHFLESFTDLVERKYLVDKDLQLSFVDEPSNFCELRSTRMNLKVLILDVISFEILESMYD